MNNDTKDSHNNPNNNREAPVLVSVVDQLREVLKQQEQRCRTYHHFEGAFKLYLRECQSGGLTTQGNAVYGQFFSAQMAKAISTVTQTSDQKHAADENKHVSAENAVVAATKRFNNVCLEVTGQFQRINKAMRTVQTCVESAGNTLKTDTANKYTEMIKKLQLLEQKKLQLVRTLCILYYISSDGVCVCLLDVFVNKLRVCWLTQTVTVVIAYTCMISLTLFNYAYYDIFGHNNNVQLCVFIIILSIHASSLSLYLSLSLCLSLIYSIMCCCSIPYPIRLSKLSYFRRNFC